MPLNSPQPSTDTTINDGGSSLFNRPDMPIVDEVNKTIVPLSQQRQSQSPPQEVIQPSSIEPSIPRQQEPMSEFSLMRGRSPTESGEPQRSDIEAMFSPTAERLGILPSKDPGVVTGYLRGVESGLTRWASSMANTFGADETRRNLEWFLNTNQQLSPSERWSRASYVANTGGNFVGTILPYAVMVVGTTLLTKNPTLIAAATEEGIAAMEGVIAAQKVARGSKIALEAYRTAFLAKAAPVIARTAFATKAVGWMEHSAFVWGDNLDQMRTINGLSDNQAVGLAVFKTALDSTLMNTAGVGGMASKAISNTIMGRAMSQPGFTGAIEKILSPRVLGRLTATPLRTWASEFVGKTAQLTLMSAQMGAVSDTLMAIDPANRFWNNEQQWDAQVDKFKRSMLDSAIGGAFGAFVPATMNAMARGKVELREALRHVDNPQNRDIVNNDPNTRLPDAKGLENTRIASEVLKKALAVNKTGDELTQTNLAVDAMFNYFYNLAAEETIDSNGRIRRRPEDFLSGLSTLTTTDPKASSIIYGIIKESTRKDGTLDNPLFIRRLSDAIPEIGTQINNHDNMVQIESLRGQRIGVEKDAVKNAYDVDYVQQRIMPEASKKASSLLGMAIQGGIRTVPDSLMKILFGKNEDPANSKYALGVETAKRVYAHGGIEGIKVGDRTFNLSLEKDANGKMVGFLEEAMEVKKETKAKEKKVVPLVADAPILAEENKLTLDSGERMNRWNEFNLDEMFPKTTIPDIPLRTDVAPEGIQIGTLTKTDLNQPIEGEPSKLKNPPPTSPVPDVENRNLPPEPASGQKKAKEPEVVYEGSAAYYLRKQSLEGVPKTPTEKLAVFLSGHSALDIIHEIAGHHVIENNLLPSHVYRVLADNFAPTINERGDRNWGPAERENMANAMLAYFMRGDLQGNDPNLGKAFDELRSIFSLSTVMKEMANKANGEMEMTDKSIKFNQESKDLLAKLTSAETSDSTSAIYAKALDSSLKMGDSARMDTREVTPEHIDSQIKDLSFLQKDKSPQETMKSIRNDFPELFDGELPVVGLSKERQILLSSYLDAIIWNKEVDRLTSAIKSEPVEPLSSSGKKFKPFEETYNEREAIWKATPMFKRLTEINQLLILTDEQLKEKSLNRKDLEKERLKLDEHERMVRGGSFQQNFSFVNSVLNTSGQQKLDMSKLKPEEFKNFVDVSRITDAAIIGRDGKVYTGRSHPEAMVRLVLNDTIPSGEEGAITENGVFVSRQVASLITGHANGFSWTSGLIDNPIPIDRTSREFTKISNRIFKSERSAALESSGFKSATPKEMRSSLLRFFVGEDRNYEIAGEKAHEWIKEKYGVDEMHDLSDAQLRSALSERFKVNKSDPIMTAKQNEMAESINNEVSATRVSLDQNMGTAKRIGQNISRFGQRFINEVYDPASLVNFWTNNNKDSFLYKNIVIPLREIWSIRKQLEENFWQKEHDLLMERNLDKSVLEEQSIVRDSSNPNDAGRRMTKNEMLTFWCASNYGKDFSGKNWKTVISRSYGDVTEGQARDAVRLVSLDENLKGVNLLRQELQNKTFALVSDLYFKLTGKRTALIEGPYFTRRYRDGVVDADDFISNITAPQNFDAINKNGKRIKISELNQRAENPEKTGLYLDTGKSFYDHMLSMINYLAKAENVTSILRMLDSEVVKKAAIDKWGNEAGISRMSNLVAREMNRSGTLHPSVGWFDKFVDRITSGAYSAFMGWNPNMMAVQSTAAFYNASGMPISMFPKYISNVARLLLDVANTGHLTQTRAFKVAAEHMSYITGLHRNRFQNEQLAIEAKNNWLGRMRIGSFNFTKMKQMGMMISSGTDMTFRLASFETAFDAKFEEGIRKGVPERQAELDAKEWASDILAKANNPAVRGEMGWVQTEGGALRRSLLAFTSQQFALMKYFINDVYLPVLSSWQREPTMGGKLGAAGKKLFLNPELARKLVIGGLLPGLALGAIGRRRWQEDTQEVLQDAFLLGLLNTVPIIGSAMWFASVMGYGDSTNFGGMFGQMATSSMDTITDIVKGKADFSTVKGAMRAAEMFYGIPDAPLKYVTNIYRNLYLDDRPMDLDTARKIIGWYPRM